VGRKNADFPIWHSIPMTRKGPDDGRQDEQAQQEQQSRTSREQRQAERERLLAQLGDKVAELANSEQWLAYLRFVSAFRHYRASTTCC
jgi:hypothetical protein